MSKKIIILEIPFDNVTFEEALQKAEEFIISQGQFQIATPNPEMLLEAEKNEKFRKILQNTALNIPDGIGIIFASKWLKWKKKNESSLFERITGTDLMRKMIEKTTTTTSPLWEKKIFFLGAGERVGEKIAKIFQEKFPKIKIAGRLSGSPEIEDEEKIISKINESDGEILFVAYGAPAQEIWIAKNLKKFPKIKIAMGVGGAFNFIAGVKKRAPKWMQKIGLEWFFRLIQEPKRIKRIYNAVIKFPIKVLFYI